MIVIHRDITYSYIVLVFTKKNSFQSVSGSQFFVKVSNLLMRARM